MPFVSALSHLRVLDLSRVLAGPWASQTLGDLGAEVIKIEHPGAGDDTRAWGPPWVNDPQWGERRQSAYFVGANRNKQSVAIDIADPRGSALVAALADQCDIVIENFKVDGLRQYGLDYATLRRSNPRLIYCSITGFGQSGPYAHRPGYDLLVQAMGGLMHLTGRPDDVPGGGPLKVGVAITDIMTGLYATVGVLAALAERERSGEGQHVDTSLLDVQVACLANQAMNFLATGEQPTRLGNAHPNIVPYQDFKAEDGFIIIAVGNDAQFARLCEVLGFGKWVEDSRFKTNTARIANRDVLIEMIQEVVAKRPGQAWLADLERCGVPCAPINTMSEVFAHPQVVHRGMQIPMPDAAEGSVNMVASPLKLSRTPVTYRSAPPLLGGQTMEVLGRLLSMSSADLEPILRDAVIRG